jgi:DHA1 family bicyclomycin/chloramphenicol resistance-like MFS transporter
MPGEGGALGAPAATAVPGPTAIAPPGLYVLLILSTLMAFASISTDVYLPALPTMATALNASSGAVALTISGYLIGFSVGQLIWGPLGDRYGRRGPVAIGLVLFAIGSAGCAMSGTVGQMIFWRVVQAAGACAGVVLARAMVRDLYPGDRAARMLSTLLTVMAVAPLIGPFVGGQILAVAGWRAIFWSLVGVGIATLGALFTIPETLPRDRRQTERLSRSFIAYGGLLRDRAVLGYAGAGGFLYAGLFAQVAGTPFAYITYYGVSPQLYGVLFAVGIAGIMAGNIVNARVVGRFGTDRLLRMGTIGAAVAGLAVALVAGTGWGGLAGLVVTLFLFISTAGFIVANAIVGALARSPGRAGSVSALAGAAQYGSGMVGSALVGAFADGTPSPMGWVVAVAGIGSAACAWVVLRRGGGSATVG